MQKETQKKIKRASILVCGSSHFTDENFVFETLKTFNSLLANQFNSSIGCVHTSQFSGSCSFARIWVDIQNERHSQEKKIILKDATLDMILEKNNHSFFDEAEIPLPVLQADPFFQKGKEAMQLAGINLVFVFPDDDGKVGVATRNIQRFAELATIKVMDCSEHYREQLAFRDAAKAREEQALNVEIKNEPALIVVGDATPTLISNRRTLTR